MSAIGDLRTRLVHDITIRHRAGVSPEMRFRAGTRIFHILSVVDVEDRGRWLICRCEERDL